MWRVRSSPMRAITACRVWCAPSASTAAATVARLSAPSSAAAPTALASCVRWLSVPSSSSAPLSRPAALSDPADVAASIARAELDRVTVAEAASDHSEPGASAARLKRAAQRKKKQTQKKERDAAAEEDRQNIAAQQQAFNAAANASAAHSLSALLSPHADPTSKGAMPFTSAAAAAMAATGLPVVPFTPADEAETLAWLATFDAMSAEERRASVDDAFVPALFFSLLRINRANEAWRVHREFDTALGEEATWTIDRVRLWLDGFIDHAAPLHSQEAERIWMRMAADANIMAQADASLYRRMIQIYLRDGRQSCLDKIESFWSAVQVLPIPRGVDVRTRRFRAADFEAIITLAREKNLPEQVQLWSSRARIVGVWSMLPESVRYAELLQLRQSMFDELRLLLIRSVGRFPNSAWDRALFKDLEWTKIRQTARNCWSKLIPLLMQEPMWGQPLSPVMIQGLLESLRVHQIFQTSQALYSVIRKQAMHAIDQQKVAARDAKDRQRAAHVADPLDVLDEPALEMLQREEVFVPTPLPEAERVPYPIMAALFSLILRVHEGVESKSQIAAHAGLGSGDQLAPEYLSAELGRSVLEDMMTPSLAGRFALRGGLLTMLLDAYRGTAPPNFDAITAIYQAIPHRNAETHASYLALAERLGKTSVADSVRAALEQSPADADTLAMSLEFLSGEMKNAVLSPTSEVAAQIYARAEALWARAKQHPASLMSPAVVQAMVELTQAANDTARMSAVIMEGLQIEAESAAAATAAAAVKAAAAAAPASAESTPAIDESSSSPAPPAPAVVSEEPLVLVGFDSFATLMSSWIRSADPTVHSGDAAQVFGMMQSRFFAATPAQRHASLPSLRAALATFAQLERVTSRVTVLARWRGLIRADKERNPLLLLAVLSEIAESPRPDTAEASRTIEAELGWLSRSPLAVDLFHTWLGCYAGQQQQGGDWAGAEGVCERMLGMALQPTEHTYTTLMAVYMRAGTADQLRQIEKLYSEMRAGSGPGGKLMLGPREFATMVRTARASGRADEEVKWTNRARNAGVWPDTQKEITSMDKQATQAAERAAAAAAAAAAPAASAAPMPPVVS